MRQFLRDFVGIIWHKKKKKKKIFSPISWIVQKKDRMNRMNWLIFPFYHLWASERSILYFFATSVSFRVGGPPSAVHALKLFFRDNATIQDEHFFALLPSKASSSSGRGSHKSIFRHVKSSCGKQEKDPKQHILQYNGHWSQPPSQKWRKMYFFNLSQCDKTRRPDPLIKPTKVNLHLDSHFFVHFKRQKNALTAKGQQREKGKKYFSCLRSNSFLLLLSVELGHSCEDRSVGLFSPFITQPATFAIAPPPFPWVFVAVLPIQFPPLPFTSPD